MKPSAIPRSRLRAALIAALAVHIVLASFAVVGSSAPSPDFDRYWAIASSSGTPYRDFQVEHPIGTLAVFRALAAVTGGRALFGLAIVGVNVAADAAILGALAWGWGLAAAAAFAIGIVPVLDLLFNRLDFWSMAAATIAVAAWKRRRDGLAGASVAVGAAFKLWPLVFVALFVTREPGGRWIVRTRALASMAIVSAALGTVWLLLAGWHGVYQVVTFRGATGWQIESTVGSVLHLLGAQSLREESGSWRIGTTTAPMSILLFVVAFALAAWWVSRLSARGRVGIAWLAGVPTVLLLSALFSAQFIGWIVPGAAIAWSEDDHRPALLTGVAVLLTEVFMLWYGGVLRGTPVAVGLIVIRNIVLVAVVASAAAAPRS